MLVALIWALVNAFKKRKSGSFLDSDLRLYTIANRLIQVQFLLGIGLYFVSDWVVFSELTMENPTLRFFTVEHISMMVIAVGLMAVGHAKARKLKEANARHSKVALFYGIAFVIIMAAIPWPFREALGAGWF